VGVRLPGLGPLGAAMLRLAYPADRWQASQPILIDRPTGADSFAGWLPFVDVDEPGSVHLGGVRLGDPAQNEVDFMLRFTAIAGPLPDDRLEVEAADLAAPDGTVLTPAGRLPTLSLDAPQPPPPVGGLKLAPPQPNPFTISPRLVVTLPMASAVDLAVHDVAGRRVATLAHGVYGPGQQAFTWDGTGAN